MDTNENFSLISDSLSSIVFEEKDLELIASEEVISAIVTTAIDLTVSEYESISVILAEKLGKQVTLQKLVEPSIIGGIIVKVGDKVFDASSRRQLEKVSALMGKVRINEQTLEKPAGIAEALTKEVQDYQVDIDLEEVGVVEKVGDGIATVTGMRGVMAVFQRRNLGFGRMRTVRYRTVATDDKVVTVAFGFVNAVCACGPMQNNAFHHFQLPRF